MLHDVAVENGIVDHIVVRSCGHILHMSLDLSSMEPFTITFMFPDCQIAERRCNLQNNDRRGIRTISLERLCKALRILDELREPCYIITLVCW